MLSVWTLPVSEVPISSWRKQTSKERRHFISAAKSLKDGFQKKQTGVQYVCLCIIDTFLYLSMYI